METDKAMMEVEAPGTGVIRDLARVTGEQIPVGTTVAWIHPFPHERRRAASITGRSPLERRRGAPLRGTIHEHARQPQRLIRCRLGAAPAPPRITQDRPRAPSQAAVAPQEEFA